MQLLSEQQKIKHLYWRAGFGPDVSAFRHTDAKAAVDWFFSDSQGVEDLKIASRPDISAKEVTNGLSEQEKRRLHQQARYGIRDLNVAWFKRMCAGKQLLREKMTLFWMNHFATKHQLDYHAEDQINTIRRHALGSFSDLLLSVAQDPAMLRFLNNRQNRKDSPNENFARELMELFTLGKGHYSEQDVKNAARAFTGWTSNFKGHFEVRPNQHDEGSKTFLGRTGNFGGQEVIEIILEQKQTARFVTEKIYRWFVNDVPDKGRVEALATEFFDSNYNIERLMRRIFTADWFYEPANVASLIKSPMELLAGMAHLFNLTYSNKEGILYIERALNQVLFDPPTVAGWPGGQQWIDSSTLMTRLKMSQYLFADAAIDVKVKENLAMDGDEESNTIATVPDEMNMEGMESETSKRNGNRFEVKLDWQPLLNRFNSVPAQQLLPQLADYVLATSTQTVNLTALTNGLNTSSTDERIKQLCIRLASLPEFQMC